MEHMPNIAKYFVLVMVAIVLTKMLKLQCYTGQFFHCKFLPNNSPHVSNIQNCRKIFRKKDIVKTMMTCHRQSLISFCKAILNIK